MKLGKRYRQLIDEWVSEITRKYPKVQFEGVGRLPEDGAIAIRLRGPSDVLLEVLHEFAPRTVEALIKYRCDIAFWLNSEPTDDKEQKNACKGGRRDASSN
jgi:hypothetical protein